MNTKAFIWLFLIFLLGCKEASFRDESDFGYNYQPKTEGHWVEYMVDSTTYNDVTSPPTIFTTTFYLREEIDSVFQDASGEDNILVTQYRKENLSDSWDVYQVGSFKISESSHQRYFNDLRFISLIFPVSEGREWQGHSFLNVDNEPTLEYLDDARYDWNYQYTAVDEVVVIDSFTLDSCLTVLQIDEENLFEKKFGQELYARNIGLVSKELVVLNTQAPPSGASFIDRAESGFIVSWRLRVYKN